MAQHDYDIANQSFPAFRTDVNNVLSAINSTNSGSSRPSSAVAGTIWLDTSGAATAQLLKMYDGAADILLGTVNFTANTIDWSDSAITLGANSVDSDNYVDGSIDLAHMSANSVDSDQYVDGSIDTIHIADDQITLAKMASGTDGNIISYDASGNPVAIATGTDGQVLTSTGAGSPPAFETPSGGGIENITTYRMTTNFTMSSGNNQITSNWSAAGASLGTAVSNSSGTFSFPQTGYWKIEANFYVNRIQGDSDYIGVILRSTTDNSNYTDLSQSYTHINDFANQHSFVYGTCILDVTNISNDKVRIFYESESGTNIRLTGNSSHDGTYIRFIRLGDT